MLEAATGVDTNDDAYSVQDGYSLSFYIGEPGQAMEVSEVSEIRLHDTFCEAASREHHSVYFVEYSSLHGVCIRPPSGGGGRRTGFS